MAYLNADPTNPALRLPRSLDFRTSHSNADHHASLNSRVIERTAHPLDFPRPTLPSMITAPHARRALTAANRLRRRNESLLRGVCLYIFHRLSRSRARETRTATAGFARDVLGRTYFSTPIRPPTARRRSSDTAGASRSVDFVRAFFFSPRDLNLQCATLARCFARSRARAPGRDRARTRGTCGRTRARDASAAWTSVRATTPRCWFGTKVEQARDDGTSASASEDRAREQTLRRRHVASMRRAPSRE